MLSPGEKQLLVLCLLPYLGLAAYDGWLHEKARRVPRIEQGLHGVLFVSAVSIIVGIFTARPWLALPAIAVFAAAACADEFGFHAPLEQRERRLHHVAYASFAGFLSVAFWLGALTWAS
jgi:hypothetical protein